MPLCPASMTMYKVQGRALALMAIIGTIAFILFMGQFYSTDKYSSIQFWHSSKTSKGLNIAGTRVDTETDKSINKSSTSETGTDSIYAIVFDAGSTGSRVHIFNFTSAPGLPLKLESEIFEQVKPGLSSYDKDPYQAAQSLVSLLQICLDKVPKHLHKSTPLVLKATAGLRLLPTATSDSILLEVFVLLKKYPFRLPADSVGIMDGVDEGVFSWMTVNFMLGVMTKGQTTVPALDMGGGSTQITFVPEKMQTIRSVPEEFVKNVSLFKNQYRLYTHSYLGLGLMSMRFNMTGGFRLPKSSVQLSGPCIHSAYSGDYVYGGKTYKLKGAVPGNFTYRNCEDQMRPYIKRAVKPVIELTGKPVYIFSYFFDRAVEAGLITSTGGTIRVIAFRDAALKAFTNPDSKFPFAALDLTYMFTLLRYGYGISEFTSVILQKKINGVEVSWGLGASFQLLSEVGLAR